MDDLNEWSLRRICQWLGSGNYSEDEFVAVCQELERRCTPVAAAAATVDEAWERIWASREPQYLESEGHCFEVSAEGVQRMKAELSMILSATSAAEIAALKADLEETSATLDDEESAHAETLEMLAATKAAEVYPERPTEAVAEYAKSLAGPTPDAKEARA